MIKLDGDFIRIWEELNGFYACPRHPTTKERLGPLVGYAGRYQDGDDQRQYVGDVYANFAVIESDPNPDVLDHFASHLGNRLSERFGYRTIQVVCSMPMGGIMLGSDVGRHICAQRIFPDKKVIEAATETSREKSKLLFGRHEIKRGSSVVIVEDVCNNFSTTDEACDLLAGKGATVIGIACALNRSPADSFESKAFGPLPVISLVAQPLPQYRQDDPEVATDVVAGNVIWKPKDEWDHLMAAKENAPSKVLAIETGS